MPTEARTQADTNAVPHPPEGPCHPVRRGMHDYHYGGRYIDEADREHPFRMGFEVEKEDTDIRNDIADGVQLVPRGWTTERDGSLHYLSGFEVVSRAYNLRWFSVMQSDIRDASRVLGATKSKACGGHVHISDARYTPVQFADRLRPLFPLLMVLYPRRMRSSYVRCTKFQTMKQDDGNKYQPFYISNPNALGKTIELRIFSAVRSAAQLSWRSRMLHMFMVASKDVVLSFNWMMAQWKPGGELHTLLLEQYTEEEIRAKEVVYWSMASFFFTSRPVHSVIEPLLAGVSTSHLR